MLEDFMGREEERQALKDMNAAAGRGDYAAVCEHAKKIRLGPRVLLGIKEAFGADHIRERGYNTEFADELYGADWLDK